MRLSWSWLFTLLLLVLTTPGFGVSAADTVPAADLAKIENAAPSKATIKGKPGRCLLVFTLAKGYIHKATPWGVEALRILGSKTGAFTAVHSNDPAVFKKESLARFDAVCFLNTCYTPFDDAELKSNFMQFVRGGKGYVGIHCSAHTFLDWPEFGRMQGAYSVSHPWHERVTVAIEEPNHPLMRAFAGDSFGVTDEIYVFDNLYSREKLRVLASLDTDRTDMAKPNIGRRDGDFGLVWIRDFGQGRVFYSAFGHDRHIFWNPTILRHYLAGIQFAVGDLAADATPSAQLPD